MQRERLHHQRSEWSAMSLWLCRGISEHAAVRKARDTKKVQGQDLLVSFIYQFIIWRFLSSTVCMWLVILPFPIQLLAEKTASPANHKGTRQSSIARWTSYTVTWFGSKYAKTTNYEYVSAWSIIWSVAKSHACWRTWKDKFHKYCGRVKYVWAT